MIMPDLVEQTLKEIGPCISGHLVDELVKQLDLTPDAARQRLSRNKNIKRLAFLPFPRNARFVYLQADYGSPKFWGALTHALLDNTIAHGGALAALMARNGTMPLAHFKIACGAPAAQKGHLSPTSILDLLQQAQLVQTLELPGIGPCVQLSHQVMPEAYELTRFRARLHTEEILLLAIKDWARKLGLVSYDKVKVRTLDPTTEQPKVGTFNWDLTAPSYLAPLVTWSDAGPKPGFLACDVLLERVVQDSDIKPFLNKCRTLRNLKKVSRCLQIFVADGYSPAALRLAKEAGIIPATPATLFGDEVALALRQLTSVLVDAYAQSTNVEQLGEVFARLSRIEGAATNLRGALFEYLVAELVRKTSISSDIRMNEVVRDERGRSAEIDVLVVRHGHSVRFIECKGYKPGGTIPDDMVQRWLEDRIPLIRSEATGNRFWRNHQLTFEFWTTGVLTDAAWEKIREAQKVSPTKYTIVVHDHRALEEMSNNCGDKALQKTLAEHFFEHPMQTVQRDLEIREHRSRLRALAPVKRGSGDSLYPLLIEGDSDL